MVSKKNKQHCKTAENIQKLKSALKLVPKRVEKVEKSKPRVRSGCYSLPSPLPHKLNLHKKEKKEQWQKQKNRTQAGERKSREEGNPKPQTSY